MTGAFHTNILCEFTACASFEGGAGLRFGRAGFVLNMPGGFGSA